VRDFADFFFEGEGFCRISYSTGFAPALCVKLRAYEPFMT